MSEPVTFLTNLDEERIVTSVSGSDEWKLLTEYELTDQDIGVSFFKVGPFAKPIDKIAVYVAAKPASNNFIESDGISISFCTDMEETGSYITPFGFHAYKLHGDQLPNLDDTRLHVWLEVENGPIAELPSWYGYSHGYTDTIKFISPPDFGFYLNAVPQPFVGLHISRLCSTDNKWDFAPGTVVKVYYK